MKNKFLKLMALFVASAFAVNVGAQTNVIPYFDNGDYLIVNTATGCYLGGGNDWGTHASLLGKPQFFTFAHQGNNAYTLDSHQSNGGDSHFLGTGLYCDAAAANWTFTKTENGNYTINNAGNYLAGNGTNKVIITVTEPTAAAEWTIISRADAIAALDVATLEAPVDATIYIVNPEFKRNAGGWTATSADGTGTPSNFAFGSGSNTANCGESYHSDNGFDLSQVLVGMKPGVYRLSAHAFYRNDGDNTGAFPYVYVNEQQSLFPNLTGSENSMAAAYESFLNGKYAVEPIYFEVKEGDNVKIGVHGKNTGFWNIWGEFGLAYYGNITLNELLLANVIKNYNVALETAMYYQTKDMFDEDKAKLNQSIDENSIDVSIATEDELVNAINNLEDAIGEAKSASMAYSNYVASQRLLANADDDVKVDFTSILINPGFETGDISGWTNSGIQPAGAQGNKAFDNTQENYYAERWHAVGTVDLNQTVAGLPAGIYELSAYVYSDTKDAKLYANEKETGFSTSGLYSVLVEIEDKGTIKFGASCTLTNSTWICMDGFTLSYMNDLTYTLAEGKMSVAADNAQKEAAATFQAEKTLANYEAVLAAIRAAEASVESYKVAKTAIDKANSILSANNFVTGAAYATFEEAITGIAGSYDNGSLFDADADKAGVTLGTSISGWRGNANGAAGVYMVSAWDIETDAWDAAHVNTWSTEGETDGSNFVVPFIEYWVGNGSLPAKTMTATLEGLAAGKSYKVTMDVRVKGSAVANKVTLTVGGGASVDIAKGNQIGGTDLYLGTFTAYGKADENGNLTAIVDVAAESGISWVAWQNTKYEEIALDFSALGVAIANAEAVNARISGGVKVLSDAIAIAKDVYSSATVQEELDDAVESLLAVTFEAETTVVARKYLAGVAKKAAALKSFLDVNIDDEIATAGEYAANAEATATEADAKADAINAYFSAWKVVALNNANFDTDINISKDGTVNAEIISPATKDKPYIYPVTGWASAFTFKATASQGTTAAYGAIVPANKGTNGTNPPAEDMFGKSEGGALHLSSGWSDQARYNQKVTLPAGKYVLYYEGYNANNTTNKLNSNYFGIGGLTEGDLEGTKNTFKYSDEKSFAYGEWKATAFDFTLTKNVADAVLNVGIIGGTGGSGSTPKMWFDNVTIYCIAETATMNISDAKYSTFIAPFDVELPEGVAASKITGVEGNVLTEETVEGTIPANTPVVLYSETPVSQTFYGQSVATADSYKVGYLTGVYKETEVEAGNYVLLRKKTTGHVGFYLVGETLPTIKANSCYLTVPASSAPMFSFGRGEGTTGIEDAELINDNVVIYDLAGRRVEKMEKGIYIVNGRKVIR